MVNLPEIKGRYLSSVSAYLRESFSPLTKIKAGTTKIDNADIINRVMVQSYSKYRLGVDMAFTCTKITKMGANASNVKISFSFFKMLLLYFGFPQSVKVAIRINGA